MSGDGRLVLILVVLIVVAVAWCRTELMTTPPATPTPTIAVVTLAPVPTLPVVTAGPSTTRTPTLVPERLPGIGVPVLVATSTPTVLPTATSAVPTSTPALPAVQKG